MKAYQIMEEIINEVSIGKWKEAAASSLPKRQEEAEVAKKAVEHGWEEYDKQARKHPEEEPALFRLAQANDEAGVKAEDRADHAYAVTRLGTHDKVNANKAIKAAKKVADKRDDEFSENPDKRTFLRWGKANQLVYADPKHVEEALEIMEAIINEVSERTKIDAYKKRVNQYNEIADAARETAKWYMDIGGYNTAIDALNRAKDAQKKEFKHRLRTMIHDKKFGQNAMGKANKELYGEWKVKKEANKTNEALEIMEAILDAVTPIFELDYENRQNVNTNKIRKIKKDKDGEDVEVVSVADELFPYEGNAKQQFNQKVLAKINDMIEGKGSLEDLIQFVRKYAGNRKGGNEKLHEAIELMEDLYSKIKSIHGEPKYEGSGSHPANKSAELLDKMDRAKYQERKEAVAREKKPEETLGQATYRVLGRRDPLDTVRGKQDSIVKYKKSGHEGVNPSSLKEALEILEKYTQEQKKEAAKKVLKDRMLNFYDKYYELEDAVPAKDDMEDLKRREKRYKHAEKVANEALQDQVDKKVANREISLDKAFELEKKIKDKISPEKQAEDTKERFRRMAKNLGINPDEKSFKKAINRAKREGRWTQAFYKVSKDGKAFLPPDPFPKRAPQTENKVFPSRNKIGEALEEILQITENIFGYNDGRGDLLDDIDTTLGSPVKKAIRAKANKVVKNMIGCKQKKIHEALDLMEEIINEVSVSRWKQAAKNSIADRQYNKDVNQADYDFFNGRIPIDQQRQLNKENKQRDDYHSDRVDRAKYLAKNLPDSEKSASKLKAAAKKASEVRTKKVDKIAKDIDNKNKKEVPLIKSGDVETSDKYIDRHNERAKNFTVTSDREKHARIIADKPLRDYDAKEIKPEKGLYSQNTTSYKEDSKNKVKNMKDAERVASKAYDKYVNNPTLDNEEKAKEANAKFKYAEKQYKNSKLSHKV